MTMTDGADIVRGLPGLVRVAASASWRAVSWTVNSSVGVSTELVRRAMSGEPPAQVLADMSAEFRSFARHALGLADDNGAGNRFPRTLSSGSAASGASSSEDLRERGESLLRQSADVTVTEEGHPAYARILSELTPDEARILRFLYLNGPQPAVDVRTNRPLGIGSELVAGGLSMIAEHAGCRHVDRIHPYLTNLNRLGLIEFSKEQVENPNRYQLIEAQPKVAEVLRRAGRAPRTVHRSIHLNAFGQDFVLTCLPVDGPRAESGLAD